MKALCGSLVFVLSVLTGTSTPAIACDPSADYQAHYKLFRGAMEWGMGSVSQRVLNSDATKICMIMSQVSEPRRLLSWVSKTITEQSEFCVDRDSNQVAPRKYRYEVSGSSKESFELEFATDPLRVKGGRFGELELESVALDPLSLQAQFRFWICDLRRASESVDRQLRRNYWVARERGVTRNSYIAKQFFHGEPNEAERLPWFIQGLDAGAELIRVFVDPEKNLLISRAEFAGIGGPTRRMVLDEYPD